MEGFFRASRADEVDRVTSSMRDALRAAPPELALAYLYGSFARGTFYEDIDVALWFDPAAAFDSPPAEICAALQRCAPRGVEVDVRIVNGGSPGFLYEVIRPARCLFEHSRGARALFETRVVLTWLDFRPRFEEAAAGMRREIVRRWGPALARMTG